MLNITIGIHKCKYIVNFYTYPQMQRLLRMTSRGGKGQDGKCLIQTY